MVGKRERVYILKNHYSFDPEYKEPCSTCEHWCKVITEAPCLDCIYFKDDPVEVTAVKNNEIYEINKSTWIPKHIVLSANGDKITIPGWYARDKGLVGDRL
jgi:hypothetical protein